MAVANFEQFVTCTVDGGNVDSIGRLVRIKRPTDSR